MRYSNDYWTFELEKYTIHVTKQGEYFDMINLEYGTDPTQDQFNTICEQWLIENR